MSASVMWHVCQVVLFFHRLAAFGRNVNCVCRRKDRRQSGQGCKQDKYAAIAFTLFSYWCCPVYHAYVFIFRPLCFIHWNSARSLAAINMHYMFTVIGKSAVSCRPMLIDVFSSPLYILFKFVHRISRHVGRILM